MSPIQQPAVPASKPMEIGDGKQHMQVNLIMTRSNDQGNPILNKMAGCCQLTRLIGRRDAWLLHLHRCR